MALTRLAAAVASTSNTNSYAGPNGSPASGDLLLCFVVASDTVAPGSITGGGWTWHLLTSFTFNAGTDTIYVFWAVATGTTATQPTFDCTGDNASGTVIACVRLTGLEGQQQPYIRQLKTNTGSTANPSVTMDRAILTGNGVIVFAANKTNSSTQWSMTNFTETDEAAYNSPTTSGTLQHRLSGETGSTLTLTNSNTTQWGVIALELYVAGTGPTEGDPMGRLGMFGVATP